MAAFNYDEAPRRLDLPLKTLGLERGRVAVTELWTGRHVRADSRIRATVPAEDVRVFHLTGR